MITKFMLTAWVLVTVTVALVMCTLEPAPAREGWQERPLICDPKEMTLPEWQRCTQWIGNVQRPDENGSCCGEADAFEANEFEITPTGEYVAIITKEYPGTSIDDGEGGTVQSNPRARGTKIVIPKEKVNNAYRDGNPVGKGIVFLRTNGEVLCYFSPTLAYNTRGN